MTLEISSESEPRPYRYLLNRATGGHLLLISIEWGGGELVNDIYGVRELPILPCATSAVVLRRAS